jgi:hypothetical protein
MPFGAAKGKTLRKGGVDQDVPTLRCRNWNVTPWHEAEVE